MVGLIPRLHRREAVIRVTRDLSVPGYLRPGVRSMIASWGKDAKASRWMNSLEDRLTTHGDWEALNRHAPR